MPLGLIEHSAVATARAHDGTARTMASRIGRAVIEFPVHRLSDAARLASSAAEARAGQVASAGRWRDPLASQILAAALGPPFATALRDEFEWFVARGAFFHNDAHYPEVMFGVWTAIADAELVFPRTGIRLVLQPSVAVVFDPFEVHAVLPAGTTEFDPDDPHGVSVFAGFELQLTADVRAAFSVTLPMEPLGPVIGSATRVSPRDGSLG